MDLTTSKTTPSGANDGTKQQPHQHHPILCKHHQAKKVVSSYTYISYGTNNLINTTRSCVVGGVCKHRATGVCKHHQAKKVVSSFTYICHLYTYKRMHLQTLFIHLWVHALINPIYTLMSACLVRWDVRHWSATLPSWYWSTYCPTKLSWWARGVRGFTTTPQQQRLRMCAKTWNISSTQHPEVSVHVCHACLISVWHALKSCLMMLMSRMSYKCLARAYKLFDDTYVTHVL